MRTGCDDLGVGGRGVLLRAAAGMNRAGIGVRTR